MDKCQEITMEYIHKIQEKLENASNNEKNDK